MQREEKPHTCLVVTDKPLSPLSLDGLQLAGWSPVDDVSSLRFESGQMRDPLRPNDGKKKRVLITAWLSGRGGIETHILKLSKALAEIGVEVTLATRVASEETLIIRDPESIPVRLLRTPFASSLRLFRLSTFWGLLFWPFALAGQQFDVLLTFDISPFTAFLKRFLKPEAPVIAVRAGPAPIRGQTLDPIGARSLDAMIVETFQQAADTRRALQLSIPIAAIPLLGFYENPMLRESEHKQGVLRVAFLGRLDRFKGIYRLLEIWPTLAIGPAHLSFYGGGSERENLVRRIERENLGEEVSVQGGWNNQSEYERILAETDMVVLPSESEGLPLVLLEAMAHGVPFAASDVGAIRSLENPHVRVFALEPSQMKQAIEELAQGLRRGELGGVPLQQIHKAKFGYDKVRREWLKALLSRDYFSSSNNLQ